MTTLPPSSPGLRRYHYVLAPETSDEDSDSNKTASVYSMQDRETEYVRDESDTCTKSDVSEYTLYSLPSEKDSHPIIQTSSSEDFVMKTKMIVVEETYVNSKSRGNGNDPGNGDDEYDSTLGSCNGETENEPSSNMGQANYRYCAWCNRLNVPPTKYRYCMKCFIMRKEFFPRKPKATKKRPKTQVRTNNNHAVCENVPTCKKRKRHSSSEYSEEDLDRTLENNQQAKSMKLETFIDKFGNMKANSQIMSNISMEDDEQLQASKKSKKSNDNDSSQSLVSPEDPDRTIGSKSMKLDTFIDKFGNMKANSKIFSNICTDTDEGQHASKKAKKDSESTSQSLVNSMNSVENNQLLEATSSTATTVRNTSSVIFRDLCVSVDKLYDKALQENAISSDAGPPVTNESDVDRSALCIICDKAPKNGAFIHLHVAHVCCCYHCAVKVWKQTKKCPTCTMPASKVLQIVIS